MNPLTSLLQALTRHLGPATLEVRNKRATAKALRAVAKLMLCHARALDEEANLEDPLEARNETRH